MIMFIITAYYLPFAMLFMQLWGKMSEPYDG